MGTVTNNLNTCGLCYNTITRKSVKCSSCRRDFHSYCVDDPIDKSNFCCSDCIKKISDKSISITESKMDDSNIHNSIQKMLMDIEHLKTKQNEFTASISVLKKLELHSADVTSLLDSMQNSLKNVAMLEDKVSKVECNIALLQTDNAHNNAVIISNSKKLDLLQKRCDVLERHTYQTNCEIRGVPVSSNEDLFKICNDICKVIHFNFILDTSNIKNIHRTFSTKAPKPIVVEFKSKFVRNNFVDCAKLHDRNSRLYASDMGFQNNNSQIFVVEHIPPWKKKLLVECKKLKPDYNFKHVWVKFGQIYCKLNDDSQPIKISSFDELGSLRESLGATSNDN